jgi:hypothetical protein
MDAGTVDGEEPAPATGFKRNEQRHSPPVVSNVSKEPQYLDRLLSPILLFFGGRVDRCTASFTGQDLTVTVWEG